MVRPALPDPLGRLTELAYNLVWSWDHSIRSIFRRLDPALWKESNHNPILFLGRVSQETLNKAAHDQRYLAHYRRACESSTTIISVVTFGSRDLHWSPTSQWNMACWIASPSIREASACFLGTT